MIHLGVINLKQDRIKHLLLYRYCKCWHSNQQKQYQDNNSYAFTLRLIYLNSIIFLKFSIYLMPWKVIVNACFCFQSCHI